MSHRQLESIHWQASVRPKPWIQRHSYRNLYVFHRAVSKRTADAVVTEQRRKEKTQTTNAKKPVNWYELTKRATKLQQTVWRRQECDRI